MYKIVITQHFKRQLKKLATKDRSLKARLIEILKDFDSQSMVSIGNNIFKLRIAGESTGKSGGYRLYVFLIKIEGILTPVSLYAKSTKENLTKKELTNHLEKTREELNKLQ